MKAWVWYLSCTLLVSIFALCLVRAFVFMSVWVFGYHLWILPRLFDESLGVAESFVPLVTMEAGGGDKAAGVARLVVAAAIASFVHWAISQPTEFDGMISAQKVRVGREGWRRNLTKNKKMAILLKIAPASRSAPFF